jgi:hypothetical protein
MIRRVKELYQKKKKGQRKTFFIYLMIELMVHKNHYLSSYGKKIKHL